MAKVTNREYMNTLDDAAFELTMYTLYFCNPFKIQSWNYPEMTKWLSKPASEFKQFWKDIESAAADRRSGEA